MWYPFSWTRPVYLMGAILTFTLFLVFQSPSSLTPDIVALIIVGLALLATSAWWAFQAQVDSTQLSPRAKKLLIILTILILTFPLAMAALVALTLAPTPP